MNMDMLVNQMKETIPATEVRRLLAIGKSECYWLIKRKHLEVVTVCGRMRITRESFDTWYDNQTHYTRIDGIPPGRKLRENSYSVHEVALMLDVNEDTVYQRIYSRDFVTFRAEGIMRITKESFDNWYRHQDKYRLPEDRKNDADMCEISYSQPEMTKILGMNRYDVYAIVRRHASGCIAVDDQRQMSKTTVDEGEQSQVL